MHSTAPPARPQATHEFPAAAARNGGPISNPNPLCHAPNLSPRHVTPAELLRAEDLWFQYPRRRILRGISCQLQPGELVILRGANGAGKTTLLRCLAHLARPTRGSLYLHGTLLERGTWDRRSIGYSAPLHGLYPELTPRENLELAARLTALDQPPQQAIRGLQWAGLVPQADDPTRTLSQGMRQRLSLARALLHEPPLRLLDEPFTHLDGTHRDWLMQQLHSWRAAGAAILLSSHDDLPWDVLADRLWLLDQGQLHEERFPRQREAAA
ncbi:MAG: heme ABC exporter ATP-binding protein CcmA [Pirellulales bacterium]